MDEDFSTEQKTYKLERGGGGGGGERGGSKREQDIKEKKRTARANQQ